MKEMERATIDGLELEYELRGSGEPVVLVHWGVSATWAEPLLEQPSLTDRYHVLSYHRAGFGGSSRVDGPITMADHAEHCRLLMHHLGIERAHVVGHSSSVAVVLQLALDAPEVVQTVVSMDAARPSPATPVQEAFRREFVEPAVERYRAGDKEGAVDTFFRGVFGSDYREPLERGLPGGFDRAVSDADTFFTQELPALWQYWTFTEEDASPYTNLCSPSSAHVAPRPSRSDGSSCSRGCRTSSRSSWQARCTCSTWRTRRGWPKRSRPSSRDTRSRVHPTGSRYAPRNARCSHRREQAEGASRGLEPYGSSAASTVSPVQLSNKGSALQGLWG